MYLVTIARLRENGQPVPLSLLAETLSISPVSVNEMCRKLQDQGLVVYRPYKGALLTDEGEQRACYILRRHRLWEVLLVDRLGFEYAEAHDIACQLEHATPNPLADRLDAFLEYPVVNPRGEPIPRNDGRLPARPVVALTALAAGQQGHVVRCDVDGAARAYLGEQGLRPGAGLVVLATAENGVLIQVGAVPTSLAASLAEAIQVEPEEKDNKRSAEAQPKPTSLSKNEEASNMRVEEEGAVRHVPLNTLRVGQRGVIVRVGSKGPVKRRMMDMGLVPGSEVSVLRVAPLGDPIEFTVKGYSLSLRKSEAREIEVEVVG
jgi:DtxR family transcriptional regulator, Mn-dependent transcriptional regulator